MSDLRGFHNLTIKGMIALENAHLFGGHAVSMLEWAETALMCGKGVGGLVSCEANPIWNLKESLW
jgi:hypothetical protein